jgi:hypothetical protein
MKTTPNKHDCRKNHTGSSKAMEPICIDVRDRGQGGQLPPPNFEKSWKFGQLLGKIKKILADLSENMLKLGYSITILHKNSGKLSTAPSENICPVLLC